MMPADKSNEICNSYDMGCPPVRGDNTRALSSGLSHVRVDNHGTAIFTTYISVDLASYARFRVNVGKSTC